MASPQPEIQLSAWRKLPVKKNELHLRTTLQCGQCFRWKPLKKDGNETWCGVVDRKVVCLKEDDEGIFYCHFQLNSNRVSDVEENQAAVDSPEVLETLKDYFQLNYDLEELYDIWATGEDKKEKKVKTDSKIAQSQRKIREDFKEKSKAIIGLRLIRQGPWECFLSFLCSQNNNIPRITSMIDNLCKAFGTQIGTITGDDKQISFYTFPTLEQMKAVKESRLQEMGFGYRAKYIVMAVTEIEKKDNGINWLIGLRNIEREEVQKELSSFLGVGQKVADCVALFSLDKLDVVPVDTHVFQIGQRYIPSIAGMKNVNKNTYSIIGSFFRDSFGDLAGWAHTVLFAAELSTFSPPKKTRTKKCGKSTKIKVESKKKPVKEEEHTTTKTKRKREEKETTVDNEEKRRYPKRTRTQTTTLSISHRK